MHYQYGGGTPPRVAEFNVVSGDYFRTMRLPILRGRAFDRRDGADAPKVAMISESLARQCFGDKDPVGQPAWIAGDTKGTPWTIIGVVRDAKQRDLREGPLPMLFLPATQSTAWEMNLLVRTKASGTESVAALRSTIAAVGRDVPIREITTPQMQMNRTLLEERVLTTLSGFFGPLALLLAAIGLYGLLAYHVACRTREIGVRAALGASTQAILRLVLRRGLMLVVIGTLVGSGGALLVAQMLRRFLFALSPYDPVVFAGSVVVLGFVGTLACIVPARRAAKVDPIVALRHT
jgi:putative ABC transport system permease protein